jgi:uncharacterized protein (TIGR02452 family)
MSTIDRRKAAGIARDTVRALEAGRYTNPSGQVIDFAADLRAAVEGTVSYPPDASLPRFVPGAAATTFEVRNESALDAAERLAVAHRPTVLNFASAKNPGGGFLNGARAQEESLCRSSGLSFCIRGNPMYDHHRALGGSFYTNYALYSPDVPVLRTEEGDWLDRPYLCSFVTAPAVNVGRSMQAGAVRTEMARRVEKVLAIMAGHGHDAIVLGAWGCGVFGNDPEMIAGLFREALFGRFHGAFARVAFAVLDRSADGHFIGPFEERFA